MLRFYADHHLHAGITHGLRLRGIDCLTLHQDATHRGDDEQVRRRTTQLGRVLVSQDTDLLEITGRWLRLFLPFSGLVWSRPNGISIGRAIAHIELVAHAMTEQEMVNNALFLPL